MQTEKTLGPPPAKAGIPTLALASERSTELLTHPNSFLAFFPVPGIPV